MANHKSKLTAIVVDDEREIRLLLCSFLSSVGAVVVAEAADGLEAIEKTRELRPQFVLLDFSLPKKTGLQVALAIRHDNVDTFIIGITGCQQDQCLQGMASGMNAVLFKPVDAVELHEAMFRVQFGHSYLSHDVIDFVTTHIREQTALRQSSAQLLSPRELRIAQLIAKGLLNKEIASELGISEKTVDNYIRDAKNRLGINSRAELGIFSLSTGKFPGPSTGENP